MYSDILKSKRNRYQECYAKLLNVSNYLSTSRSSLQSALEIQKDSYQVNDLPGGNNYLEHLLEKINSIYNFIVDNILPNLREVIISLNHSIEEALIQERGSN